MHYLQFTVVLARKRGEGQASIYGKMFILKAKCRRFRGASNATITTRRYTQWNIREYCIYKYVYLFNLGLHAVWHVF